MLRQLVGEDAHAADADLSGHRRASDAVDCAREEPAVLTRDDLVVPSKQDKNAGNSGDLLKHTSYLALLRVIEGASNRRDATVVEAHSGKGVYVSAHPHLLRARNLPGYTTSTLGASQASAFASPAGLGRVAGLPEGEVAYAGSAVLHALAVASGAASSLILLDRDPGVRRVAARVIAESPFAAVRDRISILDPGETSETYAVSGLEAGTFDSRCILHLDPFAFVMSERDAPARETYRTLIKEADAQVRRGAFTALSLFFTWGSNGAAAVDDLDGSGYCGGIRGGFQDLVRAVGRDQRVIVKWCWEYHFAMLFIVPAPLKNAVACALDSETQWLRPAVSRIEVAT